MRRGWKSFAASSTGRSSSPRRWLPCCPSAKSCCSGVTCSRTSTSRSPSTVLATSRRAKRPPSETRSSLAQALLLVARERREQIADDAARTGLDLDGDGHPGREIDRLAFDLHPGPVERHARGVGQILALRFAAACFGALRLVARLVLRLVVRDGVRGDGEDLALEQAVTREIERIDLDRRVLADFDEADVAIG